MGKRDSKTKHNRKKKNTTAKMKKFKSKKETNVFIN